MICAISPGPFGRCAAAAVLMVACSPAAQADMVLGKVIVDLQPGAPDHDDIEVWNSGPERIYVVAEPSEILDAGKPGERREAEPDPSRSGLLVTPQRLVLEPDQRRMIRIAEVGPRPAVDRIYRVTIKPVAGKVTADVTALKVLVGYDVLVLDRPAAIRGEVTATRAGKRLTFSNGSNTAQELFDGKQCDAAGANCRDLPSIRLYAGASWDVQLPYDTSVEYHLSTGDGSLLKRF
jgi:P pilus assembly chaperone PapD